MAPKYWLTVTFVYRQAKGSDKKYTTLPRHIEFRYRQKRQASKSPEKVEEEEVEL